MPIYLNITIFVLMADQSSTKPYPTTYHDRYLQDVWVGMDPTFKVSEFTKLRHLELLPKLNIVRVIFKRCVQSSRGYLAVMSYPHDLSLQQVFLRLAKRRRRDDRTVQLASKYLFDKPRAANLLGSDERQLHPLSGD